MAAVTFANFDLSEASVDLGNMLNLDEDSARKIVLGEASMLTTALLKVHHNHHSYYYGGRSTGSGLRSSNSMPARLAAAAASDLNEEDEDDFLDSTFGISDDNRTGNASPIDPILKSLIRLKGKLRKGSRGNYSVLTNPTYLKPFCEIIKNKDTSGPITGMALQSILKFIHYGLVAKTEPMGAVVAIGESVTKARFVGTDTSSDEVVLVRILSVLKELIVRNYRTLTNDLVCEIMQSCFRIAFEPRLSELLRKIAEQALLDMTRSLFTRIHLFPNDMPVPTQSHIKMGASNVVHPSSKKVQRSQSERTAPATDSNSVQTNAQGVKFAPNVPSPTEEQPPRKTIEPHGIACIYELLHYLTSLTNLQDAQNSEPMVNVGMNLLIVAFENSVTEIGRKTCLMSIVKNELCFNMITLLSSDKPLTIFASTLRLAFIIFTSLRNQLKYQMEALFVKLMEIVTTGNAPLEYRENALEYLVGYFRDIAYLPHELFYNYDCDTKASNLLENLLQLFSKNCFASSTNNPQAGGAAAVQQSSVFSPIQLLSFDALLANLKSVHKAELCKQAALRVSADCCPHENHQSQPANKAEPAKQEPPTSPPIEVDIGRVSLEHVVVQIGEDDSDTTSQPEYAAPPTPTTVAASACPLPSITLNYPKTAQEIEQMKRKKQLITQACDVFNEKPSKGIAFLRENNLASTPEAIASFIYENQRLDKKVLGEYFSKIKDEENKAVFKAFVSLFNFKGVRLDEALRMFLESFRLSGEAIIISDNIEQFTHFWEQENDYPFNDKDAAYRLSFAIIMLNVDQHNKNVAKQMTPMSLENFKSNLRGCNGPSNDPKDFDATLLKDIYNNIKNNEIVMPAEQHGIVRERYLWKCLLRASESDSGVYWCADEKAPAIADAITTTTTSPSHEAATAVATPMESAFSVSLYQMNEQIFNVMWGPTVAAITFIFDKINVDSNSSLTRRILNSGFKSCSLLCAVYGHLDNLIVSLCKFTINSSGDPADTFLSNKSQLAAHCLFSITKEFANEMRDSWSSVVQLILIWFRAEFLDDMLEIGNYPLSNQKIKTRRKLNKAQKNQNEAGSNFLTSFYSYFAGGQEQPQQQQNQQQQSTDEAAGGERSPERGAKQPPGESPNESSSASSTQLISSFCQPLSFIEDSKYLHIDSLVELIKALINVMLELDEEDCDDIEAFKLEILLQIVVLNRDRVMIFWPQVSNYLLRVIRLSPNNIHMTERVISALFKMAQHHQYLHLEPATPATISDAQELIWTNLWYPLLQGLAVVCCDARRPVRTCALTYLQRALLLEDLNKLSGNQWESCFNKVLFPLLAKLLEPLNICDPIGMDETRMRATNLLSKVYLQHLTLLLTLPTFTALWMTIVDYMEKYMKADTHTDLLKEAIPESLKNILLVMTTAGSMNSTLASITWDRISIFLPNLREEIVPPAETQAAAPEPNLQQQSAAPTSPLSSPQHHYHQSPHHHYHQQYQEPIPVSSSPPDAPPAPIQTTEFNAGDRPYHVVSPVCNE